MVDERISRAIDNDHTAAIKITSDGRKLNRKKTGSMFISQGVLFTCSICKKVFKSHHLYRKHLKLHSDKSYVCQICNKAFVHKHYLHNHMMVHNLGKNPQYSCHLCPKRFSQKGNLSQHLKFHSIKKPFVCDICKKDFYQQEHLRAHLRHHNNERPFKCEVCSKSFNIKSSLQRHMNCHTGAKPFICNLCHRGYTRRSVLMLHIQQVHENRKPYQCSECQTCFSQKGNLQAHFRRKHLQPKLDLKRENQREKIRRPIQRASFKQTKPSKISLFKNGSSLSDLPQVSKVSNNFPAGIRIKIEPVEPKDNVAKIPLAAPTPPVPAPAVIDSPVKSSVSDAPDKVGVIDDTSQLNKIQAAAAFENNEFLRFLTNTEDIFSNSNGSFPGLLDTSLPPAEQIPLSLPDDLKMMCDLDIFNGPNDWEDLFLSDSDILNSYDTELLNSPTKFTPVTPLKTEVDESSSKTIPQSETESSEQPYLAHPISLCHHDYASPLPPERSIPSHCSRTSPIKKSIVKKKTKASHESSGKKSLTFSLYKERKLSLTVAS